MTGEIIQLPPGRPSLQQVRQELTMNFLWLKNYPTGNLSQQDRKSLKYIEDFIRFGGMTECWASVNYNNEVLKRIIQRSKRPPTYWRRLINWLTEVPKW